MVGQALFIVPARKKVHKCLPNLVQGPIVPDWARENKYPLRIASKSSVKIVLCKSLLREVADRGALSLTLQMHAFDSAKEV